MLRAAPAPALPARSCGATVTPYRPSGTYVPESSRPSQATVPVPALAAAEKRRTIELAPSATVTSTDPASLVENPIVIVSDWPSPFGENVTAGAPTATAAGGVRPDKTGATVSTVTTPVRGAMTLFQPSLAVSVQPYAPSATGLPLTRPDHEEVTAAPEPLSSARTPAGPEKVRCHAAASDSVTW